MLPKLTVNHKFITDFFREKSPCCAVGLVEVEGKLTSLLSLRLNESVPTTGWGFNFGNCLIGTSKYEVIHFSFNFYGFKNYNVLINPNNPISKKVLSMMIETGDFFMFLFNSENNLTAFRSGIEKNCLSGLKDSFSRIENSTTSDEEYLDMVTSFKKNPQPEGDFLNWVCNNNIEYIDLLKYRFDLNPSE
jgi:hypothetical protein